MLRLGVEQGIREAPVELLVGTRKGLLVLRGPRDGPMKIVVRAFAGLPVEFAMRDARTGTYLASVTHWQFGPHIFRTTDPRGEWEEADGPDLPEGTNSAVTRIWVIEPGIEPGVLWAGVDPAALFKSTQPLYRDGQRWSLSDTDTFLDLIERTPASAWTSTGTTNSTSLTSNLSASGMADWSL